jgi:hypothetical protein
MNVNVCGWIGAGVLAFAYYVRSRRASAKMGSEEGKGKDKRTGRRRGQKALKSYRAMGLSAAASLRETCAIGKTFPSVPPFSFQEVHLGGGILSENKFGKELQVFFMTPFYYLGEREKFKYLK